MKIKTLLSLLLALAFAARAHAGAAAEVKNLSVNGGIEDGKTRIVIEGVFNPLAGDRDKVIFATTLQHSIKVTRDKITHNIAATLDILDGDPKELPLSISGAGEVIAVTGADLLDCSIRQNPDGTRTLVLRPRKGDKPLAQLKVNITAELELKTWPTPLLPFTLAPAQTALFSGFVKVESTADLNVQADNPTGLLPVETKFLPPAMAVTAGASEPEPLAFQFHGAAYTLPLRITVADPESRGVVLRDFRLSGKLSDQAAAFTLTATARIRNPEGGTLVLLSGTGIALTELERHPDWRVRFDNGQFVATFDKAGDFPVTVKFSAAVSQMNNWNAVNFRVAPSALQPIVLQGLAADTQFEFAGAARPERAGADFASFLPADGVVVLSWKEARKAGEGRLFFSAEMLSQISVSPGLLRQTALLDGKVMQGELTRLELLVRGTGVVNGVQGSQVLTWNVAPVANSSDQRLVVQFNQPQKDAFSIQVQMQTPLGAFPQTADVMRLQPEGATRFAGYFRVVNEGAVRLEVTQATGLSQISPEQFSESDATRTALRVTGSQRFAYRFSGADFALRIQADQILPELGVSQVLAYNLGENELAVEAEIELDVREAPLRELLLNVPKGYVLARHNIIAPNDYELSEPANQPEAELRIVFGQPVSGRQVLQLRFERNKPLGDTNWALPRIEVVRAKSVRGNVGVSADAGFRLTPDRTTALTEIGTAFFPRKVANLQSAFRLSEPAWAATMRVERLPQTVQADALHLFSIGKGVAYGSSVMNYQISGAPISAFRIELAGDYSNVEFTGKDFRASQKTTNGYLVQLNAPVSGAYTLLASYARPFRSQGDTLTFTGARPLDAQSEQGHTLVVSADQFQVQVVEASPGLLPLEPGEVPPEYRLFFDAPILAAYHYNARPFNLRLALSPLVQGDSVSLVVDRASLRTDISKEGQVLTTAIYLLKNRGNPNLRLTLPVGTELWSAAINGAAVVPVKDGPANLIPLPQRADPNAVLVLDLKLAAKSSDPARVSIAAPVVGAPVMLAEWKLEPDPGQRLVYRGGSLTPVGGTVDVSGFAQVARIFGGGERQRAGKLFLAALVLVAVAVLVWRWAAREGVCKFSARHLCGLAIGVAACALAAIALAQLGIMTKNYQRFAPTDVTLLAPVQQAGSALKVELANVPVNSSEFGLVRNAWPALLALAVWIYGWTRRERASKTATWLLGWMLLAWCALRGPNGAPWFLAVTGVFLLLHVVIPALRQLWNLPRKPKRNVTPPTETGPAPALAALIVGGLFLFGMGSAAFARSADFQSAVSQISNLRGIAISAASRLPTSKPMWTAPAERGADGAFASPAYLSKAVSQIRTTVTTDRLAVGSALATALQNQRTWFVAQAAPQPAATRARVSTSTSKPAAMPKEPPLADSVSQQIRVEDKFVFATAKIRWQAFKGQLLPLLFDPAVLTRVSYPTNALKLVPGTVNAKGAQQLLAQESGAFEIEVQYQLQLASLAAENGFALPTQYGLVNQLNLTVAGLDVDVLSSQAVSVQREATGSNTVAALVLAPVNEAWIGWKPRSRDVKRETPVFYAEISQLYAPSAGVIEGVHLVSIRPAQGELNELVFDVPRGTTITDVVGANRQSATQAGLVTPAATVSLWRFDPDTRKLRVSLNPAQSRAFAISVRSQLATGPLPFEQTIGLLSVEGAANQIGFLGLATGSEVQLDDVTAGALSPINLEDFPADAAPALAAGIPGLTVRRAFRYGDSAATATLKASPVEADVRVETQDTLSLGEDRTVLASRANVEILRAGIFRLSFLMPAGFDVETITGAALSHWSELRTDAGRVITLNLRGKTVGLQQFAINLSGPGVKATNGLAVPQLLLREAGKQRGTLLLVPEQGMQLQAPTLDGLVQLDPVKSGIRQKGVLAFTILQTPWSLGLNIEKVDPWVRVTSLQHATVSEAQVKIAANLQYQIENAGLNSFSVRLPANAESVRFTGDQVADFKSVPGAATNGLQLWEVKLSRRVIGDYLLQVSYQTPLAEQAAETLLRGIQADGVNLQGGYVSVQAAGRLQVHVDAPPVALQATEWQSIPRALQQNLRAASANLAYRLVEPGFQLALKLDRHEAAKLLPARVNRITFASVISDEGVMLTQVRLDMLPGDKPLLAVTLPAKAKFWFAFVNQNGVWPWREQDRILIPLEKQSRSGQTVPVELFYSSEVGKPGSSALDLTLLAPKFDLPLENLSWHVFLNDKWQVKGWSGTLQLKQERFISGATALDLLSYLKDEDAQQREKTQAAEQMLALGNSALQQGDPQEARRAFQSAFGLSTHDSAFNEDARVQLHNLKLQQALVGLNVRQATASGDTAALGGAFRDLRGRKDLNYTQQDAKEIIDRNSADENAAYMKLAEKLVQQQDAAVSSPSAIRASIPAQGRLLTFQRSVVVDKEADLRIGLEASAVKAAAWGVRIMILAGTLVVLGAFGWAGRLFRKGDRHAS